MLRFLAADSFVWINYQWISFLPTKYPTKYPSWLWSMFSVVNFNPIIFLSKHQPYVIRECCLIYDLHHNIMDLIILVIQSMNVIDTVLFMIPHMKQLWSDIFFPGLFIHHIFSTYDDLLWCRFFCQHMLSYVWPFPCQDDLFSWLSHKYHFIIT